MCRGGQERGHACLPGPRPRGPAAGERGAGVREEGPPLLLLTCASHTCPHLPSHESRDPPPTLFRSPSLSSCRTAAPRWMWRRWHPPPTPRTPTTNGAGGKRLSAAHPNAFVKRVVGCVMLPMHDPLQPMPHVLVLVRGCGPWRPIALIPPSTLAGSAEPAAVLGIVTVILFQTYTI